MDVHGNHAKAAPPHSFINALDFTSVRHLADYLIKLDKNDNLYNQYFWWKDYYKINNGVLYSGLHYRTFCSLCAALHNPNLHSNQHHHKKAFQQDSGSYYQNLKSWWRDGSNCKSVVLNDTVGKINVVSPAQCSPLELCS